MTNIIDIQIMPGVYSEWHDNLGLVGTTGPHLCESAVVHDFHVPALVEELEITESWSTGSHDPLVLPPKIYRNNSS